MTGFKFHSLIPTPPSTGFISFHRIDHFHLHVIIPMDHLRVSYIILARFYIRDRPTSNFDLIHHFVWLERGVSPFDLNQVGTRIFQFSLEIIHNYHGLFIMTIITIITFLFLDSFGFFWILLDSFGFFVGLIVWEVELVRVDWTLQTQENLWIRLEGTGESIGGEFPASLWYQLEFSLNNNLW